eukprot:COSAG06_NODE_568_length_14183_cov_130.573843_10_plen_64_part_00
MSKLLHICTLVHSKTRAQFVRMSRGCRCRLWLRINNVIQDLRSISRLAHVRLSFPPSSDSIGR